MIRYAAGRVLQALAVVLAVVTLTFILIHAAPGDPISGLGESPYASPELIAQMRRNYGLDQPIYVQYVRYVAGVARGYFGESFSLHRPVWNAVAETLPNTLILALAALAIDFAVGIGLGAAQASKAGSVFDRVAGAASLSLYSVPVFWLGLMLLLVFGQALRWLPAGGMQDVVLARFMTPAGRALDILRHLALPALTLGLVGAASTARFQRAEMLETLRQDYIRTARAKGLSGRRLLIGHALRTSLLPTITLFGLSLPLLFSGAVLIETVFAWPGMGRLSADAIQSRDYPVVLAAAILAAAVVTAGNVVADVLYRVADPRTRSRS